MLFASEWNFSLDNYESVWAIMVQIGLLLLSIIIGNILRNSIPLFKKYLIPSSLIAGTVLLLINILLKEVFGIQIIDKEVMQIITYHGLGIGFVAMSLKNNKEKSKLPFVKAVENGALTGGCYMLQAFVGIGIGLLFYLFTKNTDKTMFYCSGIILPLGYGQGPGNAMTWGITFSSIKDSLGNYLFYGGGSFGLTIASVGFIVASVFGVIYINIYRKKGEIVVKDAKEIKRKVADFEDENEIPDSESVDKFSIQLALVCLAYALAFGIMCLCSFTSFTNSIAWGFNFIWGVITATIVKEVLKFLQKKKVVTRTYINNYQMDRISGFAFDLMIVAGVAAIEIEEVKDYLWLLIALCVVGAFITFFYCRIVTKHCFTNYQHEMFVTNFGTVTGTASNGMILLKEIDPSFETPVSNLFVVSQFPAMIFVVPLLLLLNFAAKSPKNTIISMIIFFVLFVGYTLFLFRDKIFKKKGKEN